MRSWLIQRGGVKGFQGLARKTFHRGLILAAKTPEELAGFERFARNVVGSGQPCDPGARLCGCSPVDVQAGRCRVLLPDYSPRTADDRIRLVHPPCPLIVGGFPPGIQSPTCGRPFGHAGRCLVQPSAEEHAASLHDEIGQALDAGDEAKALDLMADRMAVKDRLREHHAPEVPGYPEGRDRT